MAVRIKDIAELAAVSPATVSLVLNGKAGVGDETRNRILKIARDMGYQGPKQAAPANGGNETVCFFHITRHGHTVNRDHDVFIADYIEGLGQESKQQSLNLQIMTFKTTPIERIVELANTQEAAGIIVLGTELSTENIESFSLVTKPVVFIDTYHEFLDFDFVDMNNGDAVYTLVSHLYRQGHRKIGLVKGAIETRNFKLREEGFIASLGRLGLPFGPSSCYAVDPTFYGAYEDMRRILAGGAKLPPALFCANDIIACGCLKALGEAGIKVPGDVSIVGFDDLPLSAVVDPPLTTIQVSKAQIGRMAVQLLTERIHAEVQGPAVKVLIGGKLIERQSVRTLANDISDMHEGGQHD